MSAAIGSLGEPRDLKVLSHLRDGSIIKLEVGAAEELK